jgi:Xaa-Pro aminopeptidase
MDFVRTTAMSQPGRSVIANIDRLNAYMDKNGLAAVAVRTGVNFTYLSGMAMPGTLSRHLDIANTVRGFMVLWPRHGAPVIILDAFAEKLARRESWIAQVEVYQAYEGSLYSRVAELIAEAGLAATRIGFEQDGLSASHWNEIQRALPRLEMVNCSRMMDEVRWIKTLGEIAQQKRAADLLDDILAEVFPTIRDGETEREVHARMVAACMRRGAAYVHGILNSSSNEVMYGGESNVPFRKGDFVRNDYVAYFDGCPGHQSRLAILGRPSAEQQRGYDLSLEIHRKTIDRCRAGVTAGEIYAFAVAEFKKKGIDYTASLVGHGLGPWFHQQEPVLRSNSDIVLEKGMILAVEPQRLHWHLQDLVLVGDGPPKLISDKFSTDQPFVIQV